MAAKPAIPSLEAADFYLRPVVVNDYPYLQTLETAGENAPLWRFRGATVSPEHWAQAFWQSVLVQMLVVARDGQVPIGLLVVYRPEFQDGHAYFAAFNFHSNQPSPLFLLGTAMFLRYCFACWPLHKLYMETDEFNYPQFASGEGHWFRIEGRLTRHTYLAGRHWDRLILAMNRDDVHEHLERAATSVASGDPIHVRVRQPGLRTGAPTRR